MAAVKIAEKKEWVDNVSIPLLSGEIHYWRLAPSNWRPVLQRAREMGLNVIATYVCWDFHEIEPGRYDFCGETDPRRNLLGFLDLLTTEGFWIILLWQADNEIDPWSHWYIEQLGLGKKSGAFHEFLCERYGDAESLNTAWGTTYVAIEDAEHIVGELMKGFLLKRPVSEEMRAKLLSADLEDSKYLTTHLQRALPAISLVSQTSLLSAVANDTAVDMIFAQQVYGYGHEGDTLIGLSTSGNSLNVIRAMQVARPLGLHTIALTGPTGGVLKSLCDVCICVPGQSTPAIRERHLPIYHVLCAMLEEKFFG